MNNTGEEITDAVTVAFNGVPEMATYGFRVLEVQPIVGKTKSGKTSKKTDFRLKPISGELGMDTWTR